MRLFRRRKPWLWPGLFCVFLLTIVQVFHLNNPQQLMLFTRLESLLYDARFTAFPPQRDSRVPIVIIDLDEYSIQQHGRWPWPRTKFANLLNQLQQENVALIGVDAVFSEPELNPAIQIADQLQTNSHFYQELQRLASKIDGDLQLAQASANNTVLGYFFQNSGSSKGELPFPFYQLSQQELARNSLFSLNNYTASTEVLAEHALEQGFVVAAPDSDGVMRRMPLIIRHGDNVYASMALTMAQLALNAQWLKLELADNGKQYVATSLNLENKISIPVSADGTILVPFKGYAGSFPTISAASVLDQELTNEQKQQLNNALVLIGTSALGLADLHTTPLQTLYPGVEAHANILDSILQAALGVESFYQQPDWAPAAALLFLVTLGLLLAWLLPGQNPLSMLLIATSGYILTLGLNAWLWQVKHLVLPLVFPLLLTTLLSAMHLSVGFILSSLHRKHIQDLFGTYVPPQYVKLMLTQPDKATMEGEQREMTVLFADICGFTKLSEALSTKELKQLLNRYLTEVTKIIFSNQGTIDKYVGDMVMAFWNAPLDDELHAQNGVMTAMAMQEEVARLSQVFVTEGLPALKIAIGLNTGPMNVGDMGSSYRRAYTVLGDAVNLGARLESLTRFYDVGVLVNDSTRAQCPDILFLPVDRIRVVGKDEPVEAFAPICRLEQASQELINNTEQFTQAVELYRQADFAAAEEIILPLAQQEHNYQRIYQIYLERIKQFQQQPPPADWQAVFTHTSK